jgi:4-hydroxyphenylpyruvate dioxygenase
MSKEVKSVEYGLEKIFEGAQDSSLLGTDYEFYVGNAKQSAHYYKKQLLLSIIGVCRIRNRRRDRTYVLKQDKILQLTTPLTQDSIHEHLKKHGDGVKVAAYGLKMPGAYEETMKRGAFFMEPTVEKMNMRSSSGIYTYGETGTYFERKNYNGIFTRI